jgi:hypothetical protein
MTSVNFCVNAENDSEWRVANGFEGEARFLSFRKISVMQEQNWRAVLLSSRICSFLEGSAPALPKISAHQKMHLPVSPTFGGSGSSPT